MQQKYAPVKVALFLSTILLLASCTDAAEKLSAPPYETPALSQRQAFQVPLQNAVQVSGQITSSFWRPEGEGFAHLGTVSVPVEGTLGPRALKHAASDIAGPARIVESRGAAASPSGLNAPSFAAPARHTLLNVLRASGPGRELRLKLGGPTKTATMPDGRELRVEFSPPNSNGSTHAAAFYVDDKLKALNLFTYERQNARSIATAMDVVHFHEAGGVAGITNYDLTEVDADFLAASEETIGVAAGVKALSCGTPRVPDPNCEPGMGDDACLSEWLNFAAASAALVAAAIAFDVAVAACAGTLVSCPAVGSAAAGLSAMGLAVVAADAALRECRNANSGDGGGAGSGGVNCVPWRVEVSNDGGVTWHYLTTVLVCD